MIIFNFFYHNYNHEESPNHPNSQPQLCLIRHPRTQIHPLQTQNPPHHPPLLVQPIAR